MSGQDDEDIAHAFQKDPNTIQLINISEDPTLSKCLIYYLPVGDSTLGSDPKNTIHLEGLGIIPQQCKMAVGKDLN